MWIKTFQYSASLVKFIKEQYKYKQFDSINYQSNLETESDISSKFDKKYKKIDQEQMFDKETTQK